MKDMGFAEGGPTLKGKDLLDAYRSARDRERGVLEKQSKENEGASLTGDIAGAIVSPINKLAKGASLARGGARIGAVTAFGGSDANDMGGLGKDTLIGAGLGGVLGKAADKASPYLEKGVQKMSSGARSMAEKLMGRALGAERGTIKSLGMDKVQKAGGQMLDDGGVGMFSNTEDLMAKNEALKTKGGKLMGEAYDAIDDASASTFNPLEVAGKVDDQLGGFYRSPINRGETNQLENTLESILMRGDGNIPIKEAQALKEELGKVANWKNTLNPTDKEKMAREAYQIVNGSIDDAVSNGANAIDRAGLSETLSKGKDIYGKASTAEKLLQNKQAREQGNNFFGLTDTITGGAALGYGGVTDDWKGAGGIMLAKKGLQKYGAQSAAIGLNKVSKMLMQSPRLADLAAKSPQAFNSLAQKLEGRMSGGLCKVAFDPTQPVSEEEAKQSFLEGN
jgi:hypothetical protein